jgi:hypothetical protein
VLEKQKITARETPQLFPVSKKKTEGSLRDAEQGSIQCDAEE